ncbi:uncharacterized protein LOC122887768 isoform X2 [Siniperca chuatsi]|uniref:uncharacterized protein LOC122887768 isoform X2 n=1 Tax=Siniperca chuatsi TaxID=119488 RepID=UPI001CE07FC5|nr:uncharacterized protein LOC122887768 isoform X2 [Siniperca chuatsi]
MSVISEREWKRALTSILEELEKQQLTKMVDCLEKIPQSQKTGRFKENLPRKIIQHYGAEESVSAVNAAIDQIPRRDSVVQDLLRPFVDKLNNKQEKENKGKKRKRDPDEEEERSAADQQENCRPDTEGIARTWIFIRELRSSGELPEKAIAGKVVKKSGLRSYQTKEKVKRFFFYVAVADETASVKVMVYGKKRYEEIKEKNFYTFRKLIKDEKGFKVIEQSKVSQTSSVQVPEELEMEAQELIYSESPVYTIAKAKLSAEKTAVSVEGTVTEVDPEVRRAKTTKRQHFRMKDDTDSIGICMWDENTNQCKDLAVGDVVKVTNVKTGHYHGTVSLSSTGFTRIHKVHSAGIQNVRLEIIGIIKAIKKETHLEAEFDLQVHTFVVASRLLAEAFGFKLEGDFKQRLLDKIPFSADAVIKGSKITKITAVQV